DHVAHVARQPRQEGDRAEGQRGTEQLHPWPVRGGWGRRLACPAMALFWRPGNLTGIAPSLRMRGLFPPYPSRSSPLANIKSAKKRARQAVVRNARNGSQ